MTTADGMTPQAGGDRGVRATVTAHLNNGMFRLQLTDGREVTAHTAMDFRMAFARLLPGDQVAAELSPFDPNKARILRLLKSTQQSQHEKPNPNPPNQRERS
jgi:translation initiation factor IF-1